MPLILAVSLYWTESSYIAPATDFLGYLPLAVIWLKTGKDETRNNETWTKWSKWTQVGWVLTTIHLIWYINKYGVKSDKPGNSVAGILSEVIPWTLYYTFSNNAYKYLVNIDDEYYA